MQFAVPQFTDVEDRLIGPLTLKQFLSLLGFGGVIMFFWSVGLPGFIFFPIALIFGILGIGITFGKFNGRPMFSYVFPFLYFLTRPKTRIYKREQVSTLVSAVKVETKKKTEEKPMDEGTPESRLKKLAYLLDEKSQQEKELGSNIDQKFTIN